MPTFENFAKAKSIAIIGASTQKQSLGSQIIKNIFESGFLGRIFPVNPKYKNVAGMVCYDSILSIPSIIDLAVIVVPAQVVLKVVKECAQKRVKNIVIISAGFSEVGPGGKILEEELKKIARENDLNILGPNCLGFINTFAKINTTFAGTKPKAGALGIISQSGALGAAILDSPAIANLGVSQFISLGNKINLTENEALEVLEVDDNTKVILIYLEWVSDGQFLRKILEKITKKKPVILIKGGRTKAGAKSAVSHTGSLATPFGEFTALSLQTGSILVENLDQFNQLIPHLLTQKISPGNKVAIITNAGGPAILTIDAMSNENLMLAPLSEKTIKILKEKLPFSQKENPLDLLGTARAYDYEIALTACLNDANVDGIITLLTPQSATQVEKTAQKICQNIKKKIKPIIPCFMGGQKLKKAIKIFEKAGVTNFSSPDSAVRTLSAIFSWGKFLNRQKEKFQIKISRRNRKKAQKAFESNDWFSLVKSYGLPLVETVLVKNLEQAKILAQKIGYPVVLKTANPNVIHKTEAGGVILDLKNENELSIAFQKMSANLGTDCTISPYIGQGVEIIIGGKRSQRFGPLVLIGLGGIYTEVFKDFSVRLVPLDKSDAYEMLSDLKSKKIFEGTRNLPKANKEKIIDIILRTAQILQDFPQILEIDFNPVKIYGDQVNILDVRFIVS